MPKSDHKAEYIENRKVENYHKAESAEYIKYNIFIWKWGLLIYSWLLRCSTARGSSTGLSLVGPTKDKAC